MKISTTVLAVTGVLAFAGYNAAAASGLRDVRRDSSIRRSSEVDPREANSHGSHRKPITSVHGAGQDASAKSRYRARRPAHLS